MSAHVPVDTAGSITIMGSGSSSLRPEAPGMNLSEELVRLVVDVTNKAIPLIE
jgi:hypothetical protein